MSTRCCVEILQPSNGNSAGQLYHHWDGYPSNMIPLLKDGLAFFKGTKEKFFKGMTIKPQDYEIRAHRVANFLIMADPEGFEIEYPSNPDSDTKLFFPDHGDLEYLYSITARGLDWHITVKATRHNEIIYDGPLDKCPESNKGE